MPVRMHRRFAVPVVGLVAVLVAGTVAAGFMGTASPPADGRDVVRVELPDTRLYAQRLGSGPPLLLIPGGGGDAGIFDEMLPRLTDHYTVITFDRRGNSRSPLRTPNARTDLAIQADDAVAVLDRFGIDRASVFGSSGGALIALDLAARHPERVLATVAHEPPAVAELGGDSPEYRELAALEDLARTQGAMRGFAAFGAMTMSDPPAFLSGGPGQAAFAWATDVALRWGDVGRFLTGRDPDTMIRQLGNVELLMDVELPAALSWRADLDGLRRAGSPMVLATGEASAGKPYERPARVIADRLQVPHTTFPGGHTAYVEMPEIFAADLVENLSGLSR